MNYFSTRGGDKNLVTASKAILSGIAPDGGLYIPSEVPKMDRSLKELYNLSYNDLAYEVLKLYLTDFTEEEIRDSIEKAYTGKFDNAQTVPVVNAGGVSFLELFHGPTLAFKDMALCLLPHLLTLSAKKQGLDKEIVILTATSGDTGKAAMEGFRDTPGTSVYVFYPKDGVSNAQYLQMATQEGKNVFPIALKGNFDDAQTAVKNIFADKELAENISNKGYVFSSANSINIGRLVPQIVYYFYGYFKMLSSSNEIGKEINICVPTGNFGNILAAWYAKQMGLPVNKLICASNVNKVLFDFFETGVYDKNRDLIISSSPSMDIIISSNLERLLYHLSGDSEKIKGLMSNLNTTGKYSFEIKANEFAGEYALENESFDAIKEIYEKDGYLIDTHTAVAYASYLKYAERTGDGTDTLIASTASPYKFSADVLAALGFDAKNDSNQEWKYIYDLSSYIKSPVPSQINGIEKKPVLHKDVCPKDGAKTFISGRLI